MIGITAALLRLLNELIDGPSPEAALLLNPEDPGLLRSLDRLSAQQASAVPAAGGASVAAHVDHLRYGLELLNRWSDGEEPFANADYSASWRRVAVSDGEWISRRDALRLQAYRWREAIARGAASNRELTAVVAAIAHLAYHMGAIRQLDRSARGPSARD